MPAPPHDAPPPAAPTATLWAVDLVKALAAQLIVWHHFVSYGPLVKTLRPYAPALVDWLYIDARMAVQAFLVVGGFLAARSLAPQLDAPGPAWDGRRVATLAGRRYRRLIPPFFVALALAIVCAALARAVLADPDTPAAPTFRQVLFHLLLIHDITGTEALTTGAWYVVADLQLFTLLLGLLWLAQALARRMGCGPAPVRAALVLGLGALSLFWASRSPALEAWALYFFAAYALGIAAQWAAWAAAPAPNRAGVATLLALLLLYALALAVDWRERPLVSLLTATLLLWGARARCPFGPRLQACSAGLSRISYWVFLIHYPLIMLFGVVVERLWPGQPLPAAAGLLAAWAATLGLAHALQGAGPAALFSRLLDVLRRLALLLVLGVIVGPGVVDAAPKPRPCASAGKDAAHTLAPTPAKADTPGAQTTFAQAPLDAPCGGPASRIQRSFRGTVRQPAPSRGRSAAPALPELRLRAAGHEDAAAISTLISDLAARFMAADCDAEARQQLLSTMTPAAIRRYLERGYRYHVGEIDGRLVGVVGIRRHAPTHTHIHHLFVAESEHGRGYASRLWAHVRAATAADDSGDIAEITVNASPYALAIYRRWGFLPDGERREQDGLVDIPMRWTQAAQARRSDDFLPDVPPA